MSGPTTGSRDEAIAEFRRQWLWLCQPNAVSSLWRKLTPQQKSKLGDNYFDAIAIHKRPQAVTWWAHLNQVSEPRAVVELAIKLHMFPTDEADWLLREMGELPIDQAAAQSEAIDRGDLVLIRNGRDVFWKGVDCEVRWGKGRVIWEFLLLACEHAKRDEDIDRNSFGYSGYENIVADRIYKLRQVAGIPQELVDYFEVVGTGTQRFIYPKEKIHIYD